MTWEQLKKYIPYMAAGLAAAVFLLLIFRPIGAAPEAPGSADPGSGSPDRPEYTPGPALSGLTLEPGTPVYAGPGYGHLYLRTLGESRTVTPAETALEAEHVWARLEDPEGWVDVTALTLQATQPLQVAYADSALLRSGDFLDPFTEDLHQPVAVRARQVVTDLRVVALTGQMTEEEQLLSLCSLAPGHTLVLRLPFPEITARYGICFTDGAGTPHRVAVTLSQINAGLEIFEY